MATDPRPAWPRESAQQKLLQPLAAARLHAAWLAEHGTAGAVAEAANRIEDALDILEQSLDHFFRSLGG